VQELDVRNSLLPVALGVTSVGLVRS
jgi:hypothetical protein